MKIMIAMLLASRALKVCRDKLKWKKLSIDQVADNLEKFSENIHNNVLYGTNCYIYFGAKYYIPSLTDFQVRHSL